MEELISDILLWIPPHGYASVGWQAKVYAYQLSVDTRYCLEDISGGMDDRDGWWEKVRELSTVSDEKNLFWQLASKIWQLRNSVPGKNARRMDYDLVPTALRYPFFFLIQTEMEFY